jgi:MoxR-vWA-beta-propeller ternary system domain bpX4
MADDFVRSMLFEGRLHIGAVPRLVLSEADLGILQKALSTQSLHLPGPRLEGSLPTLILAVGVVYRMAWRFINAEPILPGEDPSLRMPEKPCSAAEHMAADVAFHFLPGLYHRAVKRDPEDPLIGALKTLLRHWPLSGVLADITEPPETPLNFEGHVGLGFLYAQRLAARERTGWFPNGQAGQCLEVVYNFLGKNSAALRGADTEVSES